MTGYSVKDGIPNVREDDELVGRGFRRKLKLRCNGGDRRIYAILKGSPLPKGENCRNELEKVQRNVVIRQ